MKTTIKQEGDRVWLDGVEGWSSSEKVSSVHATIETIMKALGEDIQYEYLVGISSAAFRMQVGGLCPSSPHPCCGFNCINRAIKALPWQIKGYAVDQEKKEPSNDLFQVVVQSIDRGIPVSTGEEEDGLIIGYHKENQDYICFHPWRNDGKESFVVSSLADICWGIGVYTERKSELSDPQELILESLKQAVEMANTDRVENYDVGFKAWDVYIEILESLDERKIEDVEMLGNAWIYECLVQYRKTASNYLLSMEDHFKDKAKNHVRNAAALYRQMPETLLKGAHKSKEIAPYPIDMLQFINPSLSGGEESKGNTPSQQSQKGSDFWTKEMRQKQIHRLEEAKILEYKAIEEIEKVLAAIS